MLYAAQLFISALIDKVRSINTYYIKSVSAAQEIFYEINKKLYKNVQVFSLTKYVYFTDILLSTLILDWFKVKIYMLNGGTKQ